MGSLSPLREDGDDSEGASGSRAHGSGGTTQANLGGNHDVRVLVTPFWDIDSTMTLLWFCTVDSWGGMLRWKVTVVASP